MDNLLRQFVPEKFRSFIPRPTFLSIHYTWIIGWTILGSIVIYGERNMPYVDALFFGSGAATQSGLNTIDVNLLKLYQQIVLYILSIFTCPIFIHSGIVFFRIYMFEKRFDTLVQDSRLNRWSSHATAQSVERGRSEAEERGVAGRPITVLRGPVPSSLSNGGPPVTNQENGSCEKPGELPFENDVSYSVPQNSEKSNTNNNGVDEGKDTTMANGSSAHIAFVDSQAAPKKQSGVLRIPSPREFERGGKVQDIEEEDPIPLRRSATVGQISLSDGASGSGSGKRLGSLAGRLMPRSQTMMASTSGFSRHRSSSPNSRLSRRVTRTEHTPYLSYTPTVGRNSAFVDLTEEQKDELGGLEYRALKLLTKILVGYFVFFHLFSIVCIVPWIMGSKYYKDIVTATGNSPLWWGFFTAGSAFADLGFTLTPDSMLSFQKAPWPIIVMIFLIVIGNTGFPCMLRFIIWGMAKLTPQTSSMAAPLNYLLDHPRRCFTLLFPSLATWVLFGILLVLNAVDFILFIILDINDDAVKSIPTGYRLLSGIFQAASTRTAGFAIVNLAVLHPAIQVSYMVMMYISVFPIAMTVRGTNVYEESALGLYSAEEDVNMKYPTFIGAHFRNQLQYDLWYIFLGMFIISIAEGNRITADPTSFTLFAIMFEVVSAYGTVGLSLGYPGFNASFSCQFKTISKLVIIAMEIRGRHRGLPYQVDRAVLLPSDALLRDQRLQRRPSFISTSGAPFIGRTLSQGTSRANRPTTELPHVD